jgi:hypothetical protein
MAGCTIPNPKPESSRQEAMAVINNPFAFAVEEETAALRRDDIADRAVDIEGAFLGVTGSVLNDPVIACHAHLQLARLKRAAGAGIRQIHTHADLAVAYTPQNPGALERRRHDDFLDQIADDRVGRTIDLQR